MKSSQIIFFLLFTLLLSFSCNRKKDLSEQIIGKWNISNTQITNMDAFATELAKEMGNVNREEKIKQEISEYYESNFVDAYVQFLSDSTCYFNNDEEVYSWKYENDSNIIYLTGQGDNRVKIEINLNEFNDENIKALLKFNIEGVLLEVTMDLNKSL